MHASFEHRRQTPKSEKSTVNSRLQRKGGVSTASLIPQFEGKPQTQKKSKHLIPVFATDAEDAEETDGEWNLAAARELEGSDKVHVLVRLGPDGEKVLSAARLVVRAGAKLLLAL